MLFALDPEIGIGYPVENSNKDKSPLLDDFILPDNIRLSKNVNYNIIQSVVLRKLSDQSHSLLEIELKDRDFNDLEENRIDLSDTFSVFFEILKDNGNDILIRLKSIGNSSAANLFSRFAYTDNMIEDLVKEITNKEQSLKPNIILAEIAHLQNSRVGNVLYRPHLRNYEIVYLANSSLPKDKVIYASDIMLSVKCEKLFLRSKRLNKEIIPRLTNAHNYSLSTIPIYRFLCDMQYQNLRASLTFDLGFLQDELSYIPRIRYNDPDFHIRLRFLLSHCASFSNVIDIINNTLKPIMDKQLAWKIQLDTYEREIERYNPYLIEDIELLFYVDSIYIIKIIRQLGKINDEKYRWMVSLLLTDKLLTDLGFTIEQKRDLMTYTSKVFKSEFGFNQFNSKQFNEKYRANKPTVESILNYNIIDENFSNLSKFLSN